MGTQHRLPGVLKIAVLGSNNTYHEIVKLSSIVVVLEPVAGEGLNFKLGQDLIPEFQIVLFLQQLGLGLLAFFHLQKIGRRSTALHLPFPANRGGVLSEV